MHSTMGAQLDVMSTRRPIKWLSMSCQASGKLQVIRSFPFSHDTGFREPLDLEIKQLHGVILDLWVNILSWRIILQIFNNLACDRSISDPRAASSPYHGRAYHDRRLARTVAPLEI